MFVLVLYEYHTSEIFKIVGPFQFASSCDDWAQEFADGRSYKIEPLVPHGYDD